MESQKIFGALSVLIVCHVVGSFVLWIPNNLDFEITGNMYSFFVLPFSNHFKVLLDGDGEWRWRMAMAHGSVACSDTTAPVIVIICSHVIRVLILRDDVEEKNRVPISIDVSTMTEEEIEKIRTTDPFL